MECVGIARHEENHFDNISQWFPCLGKEFTFDTKFVELSCDEGTAISKVRANGRMLGSLYNMSTTDEEREKVLQMDPTSMLEESSPGLHQALKDLAKRIDDAMIDFPRGAFIRMDTRSPKDAALKGDLVKKLIEEQVIARPHDDVYSLECATDDGILYWSCISKACRVVTGSEAIELLSGSNRVQEDLQLGFLQHGKSLRVVLREWEDIHPEYEFRVFVVNNEITAMTQYHSGLYVPTMAQNKELVQRLIIEEFELVKDKIKAPNSTYTIDFVITDTLDRARIVEINDPPPVAGTSLFDWDNEQDQNIILNGPLEFRMIEEPLSWKEQQQRSSMHQPLVDYIDTLRGRKTELTDSKEEEGVINFCSIL